MKWPDPWLLVVYLASSCLSLIVLTSIAPDKLLQQAIMFTLGLVLFWYLSSQESAVYQAFSPLAYPISLVLLSLPFIFGTSVRGSTRWIPLGSFQLQPAELAKPLLILAFAFLLTKFPPARLRNIILNLVIFAIPTYLVYRQPDLGTALALSSIFAFAVFVAGLPLWALISTFLLAVVGWDYLPHILRDYQLSRLTSFLDPASDPLGAGYNVIQSMIAVGSGSVWGKGLGHGTQSHLRFLPENHTDFIFASLAEELGLVGSILVIVVLGSLLYRLLHLGTHARSPYARLVFFGSFGVFAFQTFVNIGMNIGIAPVTGVTLPLISYGGSSILGSAIILGIASSFAHSQNFPTLLEIK